MRRYKKLFYIAACTLGAGALTSFGSTYWGRYRWNKNEHKKKREYDPDLEDAELARALVSLHDIACTTPSAKPIDPKEQARLLRDLDLLAIQTLTERQRERMFPPQPQKEKPETTTEITQKFGNTFLQKGSSKSYQETLFDIAIESLSDAALVKLEELHPDEKALLDKSVETLRLYITAHTKNGKVPKKERALQKRYRDDFSKRPHILYLACLSIRELKDKYY